MTVLGNSKHERIAMNTKDKYVLITPARNEADLIGNTMQSVISQTILPSRWVIINNGSTDKTEDIVNEYAKKYPFIQLINYEIPGNRNFSAKVMAFNAGYELLKNEEYAYLGNLDADVTFGKNYYEKMMQFFNRNMSLGVVGGIILELYNNKYVAQDIRTNSVAGAIQFFRRKCYQEIGGYIPIKYGGIDSAAEIIARMHGWKVETLREEKVYHHRRVASGMGNILKTRYRQGKNHYILGYHPFFQILKCFYRAKEKPYLVGSMFTLFGFFWAYLKREPFAVGEDVVQYIRLEQTERLKSGIKSPFDIKLLLV